MLKTFWLFFGVVLLSAQTVTNAGVVTIGFDELTADNIVGNSNGIYSGDHYSSSGVLFRTGELVSRPGGIFTFTNLDNSFEVLGGAGQPAISKPNFAIPRGGNTRDVLMIFTTPVTSVSLTSDNYFPESRDIIRLGALKATSVANEFTVLAYDEKFDDAISSPANRLSVSLNGQSFSYALFQVNTESEGFDDLTFTQAAVPEPASGIIFGVSVLCGGAVFRHRHRPAH